MAVLLVSVACGLVLQVIVSNPEQLHAYFRWAGPHAFTPGFLCEQAPQCFIFMELKTWLLFLNVAISASEEVAREDRLVRWSIGRYRL